MSNTGGNEETDLLSQKSEIIRSHLLTNFHLLESIDNKGLRREGARLNILDISDRSRMGYTLVNNPDGLVRFEIYEKRREQLTMKEKKMLRLENRRKRKIFIDIWANNIIQNVWFERFVVTLIVINGIIFGIEAELGNPPHYHNIQLTLDCFDYILVVLFIMTIGIRLLADSRGYWKNMWNILDVVFFVVSLVPEVAIILSKYSTRHKNSTSFTVTVADLQAFRVIRCLMIVSHIDRVRLIVLAISKAFREILSITILLFVFAYIFAVASVTFLENPQDAEVFSSFSTALITLFQLFTLDHWLEIYRNVSKKAGYWYAATFVLIWVLLASFLFKNVVIGIMVTSFQTIRKELVEAEEEAARREKAEQEMRRFAEELDRQNAKRAMDRRKARRMSAMLMTGTTQDEEDRHSASPKSDSDLDSDNSLNEMLRCGSRHQSAEELTALINQHLSKGVKDREEWQSIVERNVANLAKERMTFCWPRDSLFKYYLILEALQENLTERQELLALAGECLAYINDR